jgi:hypothetical protein
MSKEGSGSLDGRKNGSRDGKKNGSGEARNGAGEERIERLQVMLTATELQILDDFRFKRRMPSRAAAIRELLRRGLTADGFEIAPDGSKSSHFGVIVDGSGSDD